MAKQYWSGYWTDIHYALLVSIFFCATVGNAVVFGNSQTDSGSWSCNHLNVTPCTINNLTSFILPNWLLIVITAIVICEIFIFCAAYFRKLVTKNIWGAAILKIVVIYPSLYVAAMLVAIVKGIVTSGSSLVSWLGGAISFLAWFIGIGGLIVAVLLVWAYLNKKVTDKLSEVRK